MNHRKYQNPLPPPDYDTKNSTVIYWNKPETNPIVKMVSGQQSQTDFQHVISLLDQFLLQTPPASEDEEASTMEPGEIASPSKQKIVDGSAVKSIELDESLFIFHELVSEEKRKKRICVEQKSYTKKKKESKHDKEEKKKKRSKHSMSKSKTVSLRRKSSPEDSSSSTHSYSNSPIFDKAPQLSYVDRSPSRSSKRPKSPILMGHKKPKSPPLPYLPSYRRSASRSPDMELDGIRSGRKSPRYLSPTRRSSTRRHRKHKSPSRSSPTRRSPSPHRRPSKHWSPIRRSPDYSPSHRSSIRRSPHRRSSHKSPVSSPDRSYKRRSPTTRSKYGTHSRSEYSKRSVSPDRSRSHKSPTQDHLPRHKSLVHPSYERSLSPSPEEDCLPVRSLEKGEERERLDEPEKAAAPKPVIKKLVGTSKFRELVVEDEYTKILAEEMKKRQLIEDSDEEPSITGESSTAVENVGVPLTKEAVSDEGPSPLTEDQANLVKYELGIVNPNEMQPDASFPQTQFFKQEATDIKSEFPDVKGFMLNSYFCKVCQLGLNSELTWQSHINGKKHGKMLKLQTVHEIAKGSIAIPSTPTIVSEDIPRFANVAPGKRRIQTNDFPRLQPAIDDVRDRPIPGLDCVQEIISEMDINYYCELCDAPCGPSSIMPHLIGYKHQLRCLREMNPDFYERNKHRSKKSFEAQLSLKLLDYERMRGRGHIKVYLEQDDPFTRPSYEHPGPSWRNNSSIPVIKKERKEDGETEIPINDECLDTSKGDFFCKLCDSHMNNVNMWEAHVRGKRHLKNAKKIPGDNISKIKSVKVPGAASKLEKIIKNKTSEADLIVGLNYIRETRGVNGEIYNCFLCGSCSTNYDIIQHILLPKHRLRYLEKLATDGIPNAFTTIADMETHSPWFRDTLVDDECRKMVELYGMGKVEVYVSKN